MERLARLIEIGAMDRKELIFIGHGDGDGEAGVTQSISESRANVVLRDLRRAARFADLNRLKLKAVGFGEVLPIACDDSEWGKSVNRRVDLWVRDITQTVLQ